MFQVNGVAQAHADDFKQILDDPLYYCLYG